MTVSIVFVVARFLLVVPFVMEGVTDIGSAPPARRLGAVLGLLGAASVAVGIYGDIGALVLAVVALGYALGQPGEAAVRAIGLAGGALAVFAVYVAVGDAIDLTATDPAILLDLR